MRRHDAPAVGEPDPGLHLTADFAGRRRAVKQGRGDGGVASIRGDDRPRQAAPQAQRRARGAEARDRIVAVEILAAA
jgi:hypothetical protein